MFKTKLMLITALAAVAAVPTSASAMAKGPQSTATCTYSFGVDEVTISDYDGSNAETHHYLVLYKNCGGATVEAGKAQID